MCGQFYFVVTRPSHCICLCLITMSSTGQPVPRSLDSLVSSLLLGSWDLNRTTTVTVWDNVSTSCLWLIKLNLSTHDQTPPELGSAGQHGASQIWFFVGNFVSALECVTWCFPADFYVVPKRPWNYHRYGTFPFLDAHFFQFDSKLWHFSHFPTPRPPVQIWVVCGVCQEGSRPPKTPWSFSKSSHEVILYLPLYRLTFVISNVTLSSNLNSVQDSDRQIRILEKWQRLDS